MSEYVPFGDEWKAHVMRLPKRELVEMLAKALSGKSAQHRVQRTKGTVLPHVGDPCIYCGATITEMSINPCPGR